MKNQENRGFLPVCPEDLNERGIRQLDFVYVIGDAYADHPSFGPAIISRLLEAHGFSVGIISQPDWKNAGSICLLGEPRLAFLVSAGNMDSMVNHYAVSRKRRKTDSYTPGGVMGKRPDRAAIVYSNLIRSVYKDIPIIAGGIEASLRRLAHYDYWSDTLRRSLLMDCGADLISYGMGEHSILEIAQALDAGIAVKDITYIAGTCFRTKDPDLIRDALRLPSYEEMQMDRLAYARSFAQQYRNTDPYSAKKLAEQYGNVWVVQNPPAMPLTTQEMDDIYDLPYQRKAHPMYDSHGGVPAMSEIRFSLVSSRGCFGGCSFCALTFHQGRIIQSRSHESLLREAKLLTEDPDFKGYIHDVGGPTANFRQPACEKQKVRGACPGRQCLFPEPCPHLKADHSDYIELLRKLRALPGVKKVFIRSGIRFDYLLADKSDEFLRELVKYHISGQLKVAPEHISDPVLQKMGKPPHRVYEKFTRRYHQMNQSCGMDQYLVPYLMSSHPGCGMKEAVELAVWLKGLGYMPEQVQDFYPTPSTLSTCMYYTGVDPRTMQPVEVTKDPHQKAMQRALIQYRDPANARLVREALTLAHRTDLIGYGPDALVRPEKNDHSGKSDHSGKNGSPRQERKPGNRIGKDGDRNRSVSDGRISGDRNRSVSDGRISGDRKKNQGKTRTIRNVHKKKHMQG